MKFSRWFILAALVCLAVAQLGCKKTEEEEYYYMDGTLTLSMPGYLEPGYTKTFLIDTLMTKSRSDGGTIGYCFRDAAAGVSDTLVTADGVIRHHSYTFTAPGEISTNTLALTAFVDADSKYYSSSASVSYTIVIPGLDGKGSITNFDAGESGTFTDERDGREYYVLDGEKLSWMRQNLAWSGAGVTYRRNAAMNDIFGRYYTWGEAQTACPEGWRLPTDAEWTALDPSATAGRDISGLAGKVMADLYFNGTKMWEYWREVRITDQLGLSIMPVGYASIADENYTFEGLYSYAAFWTADEVDGAGICRYIYQAKDVVYRGRMSKTDFAASVRCVRDVTP